MKRLGPDDCVTLSKKSKVITFMKFDANLNPGHLRDIPALAQQIDALGFDGLWTTETTHHPFFPLTHAAAHSQRVQLGTGIAVAFPRSPMVTAQVAWDLAEQSDGRFILGLGSQVKAHIQRRFATSFDQPVARLREYVHAVRAIFAAFADGGKLRF